MKIRMATIQTPAVGDPAKPALLKPSPAPTNINPKIIKTAVLNQRIDQDGEKPASDSGKWKFNRRLFGRFNDKLFAGGGIVSAWI